MTTPHVQNAPARSTGRDGVSYITIPIIDITDGWSIDQVKTIADCDEAEAYLTGAVVQIEAQLLENRLAGHPRGVDWAIRAKTALRYRKQALQMVARKRGEIGKAQRTLIAVDRNRLLINIFREDFPEQFRESLAKLDALQSGERPAHLVAMFPGEFR